MIHGREDLLVGVVAMGVGVLLMVAAARHSQWLYSLRTAELLEKAFGRVGARIFHAALGIGLVVLGIAIALGHRFPLFGP